MAWLARATATCSPPRRGDPSAWPGRAVLPGVDGLDGALVLRRPRSSCTPSACAFAIDVAFCDRELQVRRHRLPAAVRGMTLHRARRGGARSEAQAGAFERWRLRAGRPPRGARVADPARRPAGARRHADRQPRRPLAPGRRRAGRGRRHLLRGHPPDPQAAGRTPASPAPRLLAVHEHNEAAAAPAASSTWPAGGATVAVVTDAGMPGISDPGERLVRRPRRPGVTVEVVPGPTAAAGRARRVRAADRPVLLRGVPAPQGRGTRRPASPPSPPSRATVVLYEAPHRVRQTARRPGRGLRRRPPGGRGPRADQAPRGGVAGHARRRRRASGRASSRAASTSWSSGARRRRPHRPPTRSRSRPALAARLAAGADRRAAVARCRGRPRRAPPRRLPAALRCTGRAEPAREPGRPWRRGRRYPLWRGPLLRDDAHLLRQRRAPHRARLHDGHRRRAGPLAPAAGRRRVLPHRHRRARAQGAAGRRGQRASPRGSRPIGPASASGRHGGCSTSPTTTSSAPPSPATTRRSRSCMQAALRQRLHRARHLRGPVLRLLRGLLHRGRSGRRAVPDPPPPGRAVQGGELLLQAVRVHRAAARVVRRQSRRPSRPSTERNEAIGLIRQGLQDISISRTSITWGVPVPWDEAGTSSTSGTTRSSTTPPRSATATTATGSTAGGRRSTT